MVTGALDPDGRPSVEICRSILAWGNFLGEATRKSRDGAEITVGCRGGSLDAFDNLIEDVSIGEQGLAIIQVFGTNVAVSNSFQSDALFIVVVGILKRRRRAICAHPTCEITEVNVTSSCSAVLHLTAAGMPHIAEAAGARGGSAGVAKTAGARGGSAGVAESTAARGGSAGVLTLLEADCK